METFALFCASGFAGLLLREIYWITTEPSPKAPSLPATYREFPETPTPDPPPPIRRETGSMTFSAGEQTQPNPPPIE